MPSSKPLAGLRVLELARILAGPWAGQLLADLGADVIKVERRGAGDDTRGWGPPFVEGVDGQKLSAAYFHSCNRGKRSITADFETPTDMDRVRTLATHADIVIENFKTGGLKRYGLDYESLKALNPRLIYCSITGFGQTGPYAERAGYDYLIQAMAGMMSITGINEPTRAGVAIADLFTGVYSAAAILAAVNRRHDSGEGAWIDMALLDVQTSVLANQAMNYLVSGTAPGLTGNTHPNVVPYQPFETSDGRVIVAVGNDGQFARFAALLGLPGLPADPDFKTNAARIANRERLIHLLSERTRRMTRDDLLSALEREGVPGGPINGIDQTFADPHVQARGLQVTIEAPHVAGGTIAQVRSPVVIDGEAMVADKAPPALGADDADWRWQLHRSS